MPLQVQVEYPPGIGKDGDRGLETAMLGLQRLPEKELAEEE